MALDTLEIFGTEYTGVAGIKATDDQSGTTFTLSSTGSRSASPCSFYNGTYELVYVY